MSYRVKGLISRQTWMSRRDGLIISKFATWYFCWPHSITDSQTSTKKWWIWPCESFKKFKWFRSLAKKTFYFTNFIYNFFLTFSLLTFSTSHLILKDLSRIVSNFTLTCGGFSEENFVKFWRLWPHLENWIRHIAFLDSRNSNLAYFDKHCWDLILKSVR